MHLSQPIIRISLVIFFVAFSIVQNSYAQSILLIETNAEVYDTYKESRIIVLRLKSEMWVNYKGKHDDFVRISNYFGKDEEYPIGIFDGYVAVKSILDTARREDYFDLNLANTPSIEFMETAAKSPSTIKADIGDFYIGMPKSDALALNKSSFTYGESRYSIDLTFSELNKLSVLMLSGKSENALAVDGSIKQQVDELKVMLRRKYGSPIKTNPYPSFLEIEIGKVFQVATWILPGKSITLGVGENKDLFFAAVTLKQI